MEPKKWLSDRSVRSLERELQDIIPEQCAGCDFPKSVLSRTLMSYRTGNIKRREAEPQVRNIVGDIDNCEGVANPQANSVEVTRCGIIPVAHLVEGYVRIIDDELPLDEAYA